MKIRAYGINDALLSWLKSFLTDRFQRVVVRGTCSMAAPQGEMGGTRPPHFSEVNFLIRLNSVRKQRGVRYSGIKSRDTGLLKEINVHSYKNCVFKLLYNLGYSVQYYPENPANCISGNLDFKRFPGEHATGPPKIPRAFALRLSAPIFNALVPPLNLF